MERFWSKVEKTDTCWIWKGGKRGDYGNFWINNTTISSHRFAYKIIKGIIPKGLELDHLCRNPICCNPDHLEAVTHKENILRGIGPTAQNKQKTHCPKGHEFTKENTYVRPNGMRNCRKCHNERMIFWNRKNGITKHIS